MTHDDRCRPGIAPDRAANRPPEDLDRAAMAGEDRREYLPREYQDVPEPLDNGSKSSLGSRTDPTASTNRHAGLRARRRTRSRTTVRDRLLRPELRPAAPTTLEGPSLLKTVTLSA